MPATATRQFRIVSRQFGYPMFASSVECQFSDREDEAFVYVEGEDSPETKLCWWCAVASKMGLDADTLEVDWH